MTKTTDYTLPFDPLCLARDQLRPVDKDASRTTANPGTNFLPNLRDFHLEFGWSRILAFCTLLSSVFCFCDERSNIASQQQ